MQNFTDNPDLIYPTDENFPPLLREINDPPEKLYAIGNIQKLREISHPNSGGKVLCVVGSRAYTSYGKAVVEKLIGGLKGYNVCIVSGLALGIDSIAHRAALDAGLYTVSFPGSGLDPKVLHPKTHLRLAEEIIAKGGALISEFEPLQHADTWTFLKRNRLMAGASHATLVIEAGLKSGTLVTSARTLDYNRDLGAVPGSIFSELSAGPHFLIGKGATSIGSIDDLLEFLGYARRDGQSTLALETSRLALLSDIDRRVISLLQKGPHTKDELIRNLQIDPKKANVLISSLELEGYIKEDGGVVRLR